jgi:hypothetical protein
MLENSRMTQTDQEIAGSARFFRSLLGDRWSFYCVLDEAGKIILEQKVATTPEGMKPDIWEDTAESDRPGDRNPFALGQPAINRAGTRSDRGARAKSAIDHQEQSKR